MATPALNDTTSDNVLAALRRGARERGLLRPATSLYALRLAALLPLLLVLQLVAWSGASGPLWWLSALAAGIVAVQIGFVAHDAGHRAVGRSGWVNQAAGQLAFSVVNGLGFQSWIARHDAHHAHCQDESQDPDMWVGTVMSLTPDSAARKTGVGRLLLPLQAYYFWPVSLLFAHSLRIESLFQSYSRPRAYLFDVLLLPLHYGLWWVAPLWLVGMRVPVVYSPSTRSLRAWWVSTMPCSFG